MSNSGTEKTSVRPTKLSLHERAQLALTERKKGAPAVPRQQVIFRRESSAPAPLSFAQQRLWFLDQLEPGSATYNIPAALQMSGHLNVEALERTINEIVRRHEMLRTIFANIEGRPVQVVSAAVRQSLPIIDLTDLPPGKLEDEARRLRAAESEAPFDLTRGPLLRVKLLRLGEREHVLLMTMHHIISDGWSIGVFLNEMTALYAAFLKGESSSLPELPVQYGDFALWQREYLSGEVLERQLVYWREQLKGSPVLELTTDYRRPPVQTFRGADQSFIVPVEVVTALKRLSHEEGATLFMTLLAAFQLLLSRYSRQDEIVVGTPVANRNREEIEPLIGFFVNMLALRTNLGGVPLFPELLRRVREVCLGAYTHQDVPFEKLVEQLHPERDFSRSPLFQVMFIMQNAPAGNLQLPGLKLNGVGSEGHTSKFDLMLTMAETDEGRLRAMLQYNTDLFAPETVSGMTRHFQTLLASIAADPRQRLNTLSLLDESERRQLVVEWNRTAEDFPAAETLTSLFERQVERSPEAIAVLFGGEELSYEELNSRANRLAHQLRSLGVRPEIIVGICVERGLEMVVGILGVLKAGGAYLPLDPAYPPSRLSLMLEDAGASVLLTQRHLLPMLPETPAQVLCLDLAQEASASHPTANLAGAASADNLAYVIYTSGSTGRPKGVAIEHGNACTLVRWSQQFFTQSELSAVLASTSMCFDLSVWELFAPLSCGGRLFLVENALGLSRLERAGEVKLINTVPSVMAELVRGGSLPPGVEVVNLAGEALPAQLVEQLYERGVRRVNNLYGPTEDTTYSTAAVIERGARVTIGRPIANTQVYVLDEAGELAGVGMPGELHLGGAGVARGYLGRPELTASRFIPDRYGRASGGRLYATGDLARWLPDGNLEYLRRLDEQVKVRGFRIELGEIESVLRAHGGVSECVVMVREDDGRDKRLVAYVVANLKQGEVTVEELRGHLRGKLPEYMVPSNLIFLRGMPLTPNGKLDRKALPAPTTAEARAELRDELPRTPSEDLLGVLWRDVLGVERVGIHDNFFELGGHSLLAAQLVSRIRETFAVDLPVRAIFDSQEIAGLADEVERVRSKGVSLIERISRDGVLPLSLMQEQVRPVKRKRRNDTRPRRSRNMHLAFHVTGRLRFDVLEKSVQEIVRRHESLRTTYLEVDETLVPSIATTLPQMPRLVDLQSLPDDAKEQEARRIITESLLLPFDIRGDVLMRAVLLRLDEREHILAFVFEHFIFDAWSRDLFLKELSLIYNAFCHDQPSPLPDLKVQFVDYAAWQRKRWESQALEDVLDGWRRRLDMSHPFPKFELPDVLPKPAAATNRGQAQSILLPPETLEGLNALNRSKRATMFMVLLAAWKVVMYAYSGKERVGVVSPVANRQRAEVQQLIGWIASTLIFPTDLSGNPGFSQLLERVRETCLWVYERPELPISKLMELLQPDPHEAWRDEPFVFFMVEPPENAGSAAAQSVTEGLQLRDLAVRPLHLEASDQVMTPGISVYAQERIEGLKITVVTEVERYKPATIDEMLELYRSALEAIVADPEQRLSDLSALLRKRREVSR